MMFTISFCSRSRQEIYILKLLGEFIRKVFEFYKNNLVLSRSNMGFSYFVNVINYINIVLSTNYPCIPGNEPLDLIFFHSYNFFLLKFHLRLHIYFCEIG